MNTEEKDILAEGVEGMTVFFVIMGFVFIIYCLCILFAGYGTKFFLVWGVLGILSILWGKYGKYLLKHTPLVLKKISACLVLTGIVLFVVVEGMIISGFFAKGPKNLDYILVLGAQLKKSGPSYVLQLRLDEAYDYLIQNENTKVIVSGGQGSNEPDTEAQGMYDYLVGKGIAPDRILLEDASKNTNENIRFSSALIDPETDSVGIVTSNFHVFRALRLAEAAGYEKVHGIAAGSHPGFLPNNMLREFLGVVKDFLTGNFT